MSFTRFHDDPCRIAKQVEESSNVGKYIMNVPGNGLKPYYMEDPYVRLQKWGGNLQTNVVAIENSLKGLNRPLKRDCVKENNYKNYLPNSSEVEYPNYGMFTEQPRAMMPAWNIKGQEQNNFNYLLNNPQNNAEIPFVNNVSSRITEKDYFDKSHQ
tara:strand:+ start:3539 stop:4006 length:468 start_codon:yes stop_codon:yes gene_type:complete